MNVYIYLVFVRFTISWVRLHTGAGLVRARRESHD